MTLNNLKNSWPLFVLIALHACILFYDYTAIPFYHDELSAIERCKFSNFSELIQKGVMVDGHPAGIHLFLFSLIKLFGIHEWLLKLPFVLAGIGSLVYLYKSGEFIFSKTAAITSSIFFIFLSYYISQMIVVRPYSPGLFFTLGAFYYALKIKKNPFRKYRYFMLALFSTGAMYAHYFSFLQVLLIWIVVFIFNHRKIYLRYYLMACGASMVCFLPHIYITYVQLGMGGLGWLGIPDFNFFTNFFYTYFNSNLWLILIAGILFILSFLVKKPRKKNKASLLLLFFIPLIILFVYSIGIAPVLQPPALYFCSPFLLLFMGNGIDFFTEKVRPIIIIPLLFFSAYVLIIVNKYYNLRNYQPIEKFVINSKKISQVHDSSKVLFCWAGNSKYIGYYLHKQDFKQRFIVTDTLQNIKLIDFKNYDELACNQLSPALLYELSKTFPYVKSVENNLLYTFMVLTKVKTNQPFYSKPEKLVFKFDTAKEWSETSYTFKLDKLVPDQYRYIEFVPQLDSVIKGAELVLETYRGSNRIDWRSVYLEPGNILSIKLKDVVQEVSPGLSLKIYIWNTARRASVPIEVQMFKRPDNPWEYNFKPD